MAFGVQNKEQFQKFQETIGAKNYLNGGDIPEGGSLTIRIVPWIYRKQPIAILPHLEGWSQKKEKGKEINTPHRFEIGEEIPDDIPWKRDTYNGKPTVSTPKSAVAFLCYDRKSHGIKLASFNQFGFLSSFNDYFTEGHDSYVDNITEHDLIIKKGTDKKMTVSIKPGSKPELDDEILSALETTMFNFEAYMQGEDPFEQDPERNINWKEVQAVLGGGDSKPNKANKNTTKKTQEKGWPNWREVVTPGQKILGEQPLETLQKMKATLEKRNDTNSDLYKQICYGIEHFNDEEKTSTDDLTEEDTEV